MKKFCLSCKIYLPLDDFLCSGKAIERRVNIFLFFLEYDKAQTREEKNKLLEAKIGESYNIISSSLLQRLYFIYNSPHTQFYCCDCMEKYRGE